MLVMIIIILTQMQLGERALLFSSLAALKESLQDQVWSGLQLRNYVGASLTDEPIIAF